jgi:hypothetical protein
MNRHLIVITAWLSALWLGSAAWAFGPPTAAPSKSASESAPTLAQLLAAGRPYVLVTRRDAFPRPSEGRDRWIAIEGYYVPEKGTWTSSATGFPTPGTPWHSCPAPTWCGGVHERGLVLERWYRPEQNEIVVIGQKLTFDEQGRVFHAGRQIGMLFSPTFPN